ncbi:unnamed protein product [Blepharisma stoltei]|uniref:Uncharacterized protein n=1 Tax=Blepharisma stoltei TaxID=1481888 RepID=A0AAU9JCI7_9CILI|nr:unnamed protein product [Blepharisma stoltei]
MPKKFTKLLNFTLETLIWKELFNYKFYFSPDSFYESSSFSPKLLASPTLTEESKSPSPLNTLPHRFPKLRLKESNTSNGSKKRIENSIEIKEPCKQNVIQDQKIKKISKMVETSDEDQENHENDPPLSEVSENLSPLQEYAKYYRERLKSLPKKRKREATPPSPKIIGKQREVFKAFGNKINVYKQTKFVEECETSNFVLGEINLHTGKKDLNERKNDLIVIEKPKIPHNLIKVHKFQIKADLDSFERILQRAENRKADQSCGVEENPESNDNNS